VSAARIVTAVLLGFASIGAIVTAADASVVGRVAGVFAATLLVLVAVGVARGRLWAYGSALLLGLCWFWAAFALWLAGSLRSPEAIGWLAWSVVVVVGSVRSRAADVGPRRSPDTAGKGVHPQG
jgi:hypothetical protein